MDARVVIVGASVAGIGTADELRRCGHRGPITVIDAQPHLPYDRPPLTKAWLTDDAPSSVAFHSADHYRDAGIGLRLGMAVVGIDAAARTVTLADGETLAGDALVIATGARARAFPAADMARRALTVRDLDDAIRLRKRLAAARSLAVIGGGFIGAEVASSARRLGIDVTVFEADPLPFLRLLGSEVADRLAALHRAAGVGLRVGARVSALAEVAGGGTRVVLADGGAAAFDLVVAGLGATPNVEFLQAAGLEVADGVVCDDRGRTRVAGVFAAGDVAAWADPRDGICRRAEHWTSAREQGRIVAHAIVGADGAPWSEHVPYFWSDLYGCRLQVLGETAASDVARCVHEDPAKRSFLVEYLRDGRLVAVAGCNAAGRLMRYRPRLCATAPIAERSTA